MIQGFRIRFLGSAPLLFHCGIQAAHLGPAMVECSLRLAGFEPDDGFRRYEALLAGAVLYSGPYEPPAAGDATAVQQAVRQHSVQYSLGWHGGGDAGKLAFMQDAMRTVPRSNDQTAPAGASKERISSHGVKGACQFGDNSMVIPPCGIRKASQCRNIHALAVV